MTIARYRAALERIRDEDDSCGCLHNTPDCCAKVGEHCAYCTAAVALADDDAPDDGDETHADRSFGTHIREAIAILRQGGRRARPKDTTR